MKKNILKHYLNHYLIFGIFLVMLGIAGCQFLISLIYELGHVGHGNYTLHAALHYLLLITPISIYQVFPMIVLLGTLLGVSLPATYKEIIAMRALGVSTKRITLWLFEGVFAIVLLMTFIGEGIAPHFATLANIEKGHALSAGQTIKTDSGIWVRDQYRFIHIDQLISNRGLIGVTQFELNANDEVVSTLFAKTAMLKNHHWYLENVSGTILNTRPLKTYEANILPWQFPLDPILLNQFADHPANLSLWQLFNYLHYQKGNHLHPNSEQFVFWQRIFQPLFTLLLAGLIFPFAFSSARSIHVGFRMVLAFCATLGLYLLNRFLLPLALLLPIPMGIFLIFPLILLASIELWIFYQI